MDFEISEIYIFRSSIIHSRSNQRRESRVHNAMLTGSRISPNQPSELPSPTRNTRATSQSTAQLASAPGSRENSTVNMSVMGSYFPSLLPSWTNYCEYCREFRILDNLASTNARNRPCQFLVFGFFRWTHS